MNLIIISPFWNSSELTKKCIESLKNQYYTNFKAYFIDDMSTDNSYDVAKETIGDDNRFILIKNKVKKHKTKNFIDIIRDNYNIRWDDVIIELDGDDRLSDNFVLGQINKVFMDENIWVCGSKWKDQYGRLGNYGKPKPSRARKTSWNFSHLRTFRSFLFNLIDDDDLKFEGEYFKAGCDLGHGIPILEMCGEEHFHYIDEPLYTYIWHDRQSYSDNTDFKDKTLQGRTAKHIYGLKSYLPVKLDGELGDKTIQKKVRNVDSIPKNFNPKKERVLNGLGVKVNGEVNSPSSVSKSKREKPKLPIKDFNPKKDRVPVNYDQINQSLKNKSVYIPKKDKPSKQNKPKDRKELIELKKGSIAELAKKMGFGNNKRTKR
jgi:glycosyltransferase involved in cell wall biosynthesis